MELVWKNSSSHAAVSLIAPWLPADQGSNTHVESRQDLPKDDVVPVQVRRGTHEDGEVSGVGVRAGVGHAEGSLESRT